VKVTIVGAGKVGRALAREARTSQAIEVTLRPARRALPRRPFEADLVILAVRDTDLVSLARALAERGLVARSAAVVHVAGALDTSPLQALRDAGVACAQMHPMISFASTARTPSLARGGVHVRGDARAVRRARAFARALGMAPRTFAALDTVGYHAAAGLVANGAAALAALGAELLVRSGVDSAREARALLGPLLRSVAENVERLGFPAALTGPGRRGDRAAVERHSAAIRARLPAALPLFFASAEAQLPLARALGEVPRDRFDELDRWLRRARALKG